MDHMQAFWLGLAQGLTEFLPVSSSGHLVLMEKLFGIVEPSLAFSVILHLGTLIAVIAVYFKRIVHMILHPVRSELPLLVLATVPTVALVAVMKFVLKMDLDVLLGTEYLGYAFLMTTLILWLSDLVGALAPKMSKVRWFNALVMGVMQAVAVIPGISRSGSTISGGVATGLPRKRAADFAFLMSLPAILGSVVLEAPSLMDGSLLQSVGGSYLPVIVGAVTSAVAGFLAIKFMLGVIRKLRLTWFGLYTGVLGVLILLDQYLFHFVF